MAYKSFEKHTPVTSYSDTVKVIARIEGYNQDASIFQEYKILNWSQKDKCFREWGYNSKGDIEATCYNYKDAKPGAPYVTHWDYLKKVPETLINYLT